MAEKNKKSKSKGNLTELEKQEIRDKIASLKYLKEPYIKTLGMALPIFFTAFIFLFGVLNSGVDNMFEINSYNITLNSNVSENFSQQGTIQPITTPNMSKIRESLSLLLLTPLLIYFFFFFIVMLLLRHEGYDKQIKILYNRLLGVEPQLKKYSKIRLFLKRIFKKK